MPPPEGTTSRTTISPCSRRQSWLADSPTGLACADAPATTSRATSSTQRFMRTEPPRKNERARDRLLVTSAFLSQSGTGAQGGKAKTQWGALVRPLGLTAGATGPPVPPAWPHCARAAGARGMHPLVLRVPSRRWVGAGGLPSRSVLGAIRGSALPVLDLTAHEDAVEQTLTAYVRIDNRVAAAIAKLLVPLCGYLA